ncbi:MAG: hypothetical protein ACOCXM_11450 [Myxococcota bacterium]
MIAFAALMVLPSGAQAEGAYEGTWRAGPMRVRVAVKSWGADCGPQPPASSTEPGGPVHIEGGGDTMRLSGAMTWRSDQCFTANRSARRVSASSKEGSWSVTCRTPDDDPKAERGTYRLRATGPDALVFREQSRYDWELKDSRCIATRVAERTLTRNSPAPSPEGTETETKRSSACTPGTPAKLALSPSTKTIEPGERVCFYARVTDAEGCAIDRASVRYTLDRPPSRTGRMRRNCFEAATTAAEAEGTFHVRATVEDLGDRATVVVRAADLSDLIARGALASDDTDGPEARGVEREEATRVAARAGGTGRGSPWPLVAAGAALVVLLGLAVAMVVRRHRGSTPAGAAPRAPGGSDAASSGAMPVASAQPPGPPLRCPVCQKDYPPGTLYCPVDGAPLDRGDPSDDRPPRQAMICPTCRRGYAPEARFCPHDSEELMPYTAFMDRQRQETAPDGPGRICPTCGERYAASVAYCGKDGSALVLVN